MQMWESCCGSPSVTLVTLHALSFVLNIAVTCCQFPQVLVFSKPFNHQTAQLRETNQMVEEMMLLANCTVAEHILRAFPACALLRRHPTPEPKQFEPLLNAAAAVGIDIDPDTSKVTIWLLWVFTIVVCGINLSTSTQPVHIRQPVTSTQTLAASLDAAQREDDPLFNKLLRIMATRCMTQVREF